MCEHEQGYIPAARTSARSGLQGTEVRWVGEVSVRMLALVPTKMGVSTMDMNNVKRNRKKTPSADDSEGRDPAGRAKGAGGGMRACRLREKPSSEPTAPHSPQVSVSSWITERPAAASVAAAATAACVGGHRTTHLLAWGSVL